MKSFALTKRKTHPKISNILKESYSDMRGLSVVDARQFCNKNGIETQTTLNDSEIEKEVTKSIVHLINKFLKNIVRKILKSLCTSFFYPITKIPNKKFTPYLLSLSSFKVGGNYGRKMMTGPLRSMGVSILERKVANALKKICPSAQAEFTL